jgi:hypothetical protein
MTEHDVRTEMDGKRPALVAQRAPIRACLTRWTNDYDTFIRENDRNITPWGPSEYTWFDTHEVKVTLKCNHLEDMDNEILATYPEEFYAGELAAQILQVEVYWGKFKLLVNRCKAWALEYHTFAATIAGRLATTAAGVGGAHVAGMPTTAKLQLPKQQAPTFDGDQIKWPEFWDRFGPIDSNPSLTPAQKLDYLKQCLTGNALLTISFLPTVDKNYAVACDLLVESYDNERKIVAAHLEKMMNFCPLRSETPGGLKRLL